MRDRLIKLLFESELFNGADGKADANFLADHLLANGVIVPPCKVGDTVYQICNGGRIYESTIKGVIYDTSGIAFDERAIGKNVFLTREDAEKALAEKKKDDESGGAE